MEWSTILSNVLQAVLIVLLPPLVVAGVRFIWAKAAEAWQNFEYMQPDVADLLERAAKFAVRAAEQAGFADLIENKKQYALEIAEQWLTAQKITVDLHLIDAAIEAAVIQLFPHEPEPPEEPELLTEG